MVFRFFVLSIALIGALAGCTEVPLPDAPKEIPVGAPLDFSALGREYELHALIDEEKEYTVRLYFFLTCRNRYSYLLDRQTPEQARQIYELTGLRRDPDTGKLLNEGPPISLRVKIIRSADQHQILDHLVASPQTSAVHMGRYTILATARLEPGIYKVHVTCLDGPPELFPLIGKLALTIATSPK